MPLFTPKACAANYAAHSIDSVGVARMVCGLLLPFGLTMVELTGAELKNAQ